MVKVFEPFPGAFDHILGPDEDWPDIPDTTEQRALIAEHNERMRREHPNLVQIDPPIESGEAKE